MCGIAGILNLDGAPASKETLARMIATLVHRGPDDGGLHLDGPMGMGNRRLAIIDLSPAGHQPLSNEDASIWLTFNGEIYNYPEIRRDLEHTGHRFASSTDSEVVIHAYEEWGEECLGRMNGMFGFALWDARERRLWLVRDRMGIKPLFYWHAPHRLAFGSEVKAVLEAGEGHPFELDYQGLAHYLTYSYTPAPFTLFKGIRQLPPGHSLRVDAQGRLEISPYWRLKYEEGGAQDEGACLEELDFLLRDAVRLRMRSDVPFGAYLSGGVDSSAVAYFMSREQEAPLRTYSVGFRQPSFDERPHASRVASHMGAEHRELILDETAMDDVYEMVRHAEEPTGENSMLGIYCLTRMARPEVTVVLCGDGADEILAGYETYQAHYLHRIYRRIPKGLRRGLIAPLIHSLRPTHGDRHWEWKLKRFAGVAENTWEDAHASWRIMFRPEERAHLVAPAALQKGADADGLEAYRKAFAETNARHPLNRMLYADLRVYLANEMLVKLDRMTMAHGMEARVPFLDHRLVEFSARLSPRLKLRGFWRKKYLLKRLMRGRLPKETLRRGKQGFNLPLSSWISDGWRAFILDHLSPARVRDMAILNPGAVRSLLDEHFAGRRDHGYQIWCLLYLSIWWNQFSAKISR